VGFSQKKGKEMMGGGDEPPDSPTYDRTSLSVRKAEATTALEEAKAQHARLKYEIEAGNYLPRDAYREASATLLAEVAQALRSLPDLLERKCSLSPEQVARVEQVVDEALSTLSIGLELFTEQKPAGT
jgi:hypothetical protein